MNTYLWGSGLISSKQHGYYAYNGHGDVTALIGQNGVVTRTYQYDAFGMQKNPDSADTNPFRYSSQYYDLGNKTYYLRARCYDPTTGRFLTKDPIKNGTNYYIYCRNNPVAFIDPSGLANIPAGYVAVRDYAGKYYPGSVVDWNNNTKVATVTYKGITIRITSAQYVFDSNNVIWVNSSVFSPFNTTSSTTTKTNTSSPASSQNTTTTTTKTNTSTPPSSQNTTTYQASTPVVTISPPYSPVTVKTNQETSTTVSSGGGNSSKSVSDSIVVDNNGSTAGKKVTTGNSSTTADTGGLTTTYTSTNGNSYSIGIGDNGVKESTTVKTGNTTSVTTNYYIAPNGKVIALEADVAAGLATAAQVLGPYLPYLEECLLCL